MRENRALQIPQTFPEDPAMFRRDIERTAAELKRHADGLGSEFARRIAIRGIVTNGDIIAEFEGAPRLSPRENQSINLFLPKPNRDQAGRVVSLLRVATTGFVYVYGSGALVNGRTRIPLNNAIGWSQFLFDGENYYGDKLHGVPANEEL